MKKQKVEQKMNVKIKMMIIKMNMKMMIIKMNMNDDYKNEL